MTGSSSKLNATQRHHGSEQALRAEDPSRAGQTVLLDCGDDPTVPTGNDPPPHSTLSLEEAPLSDHAVDGPPAMSPTSGHCQQVAMTAAMTAQSEHRDFRQQQNSEHPLDLLTKAIAAAQSGNKVLARLHLEQAVASNPDNPVGWLWLAWVSDSPAAAVSALEQARLGCPNPALLEHGLAWARGMQEFPLDLSGLEHPAGDRESPVPTAECTSSDPLDEKRLEDRCAGTVHPGPATQLLEFAKETEPATTAVESTHCVLPVAECGPRDPGTTRAEATPSQTFPLDQETAPAKLSGRPAIKHDGGTGSAERDESSPHNAMATPSSHMSAESSAPDCGMTIAFGGSESAEFLSGMNPTQDLTAPDTDSSQTSGSPPSVAERSGDQPNQRVSETPSMDDQTAVEDRSPSSIAATPPDDLPTILAIDDSPTVRSLVSITLQKCGYHVVTATDGVDALDRLKSCTPALILMDVNMPRLNGYQLCKLLKKHKDMRTIPVIMLSGKDGVFDKLRGNMCGCDDYITKPFESADLVRKVSAFLTGVMAHA